MKSSNREFEIIYSQEELERKVEEFKFRGYKESDIHVLAKDGDRLGTLGNHTDVQTEEAGSAMNKFKAFFSGEDAVREELDKFNLERTEADRLEKELNRGGILLYTDHLSYSRDDDNFSSFGDDTRTLDSDVHGRNTAVAPFGRDVERDTNKFDDARIIDEDVQATENNNMYARDASHDHSSDDRSRFEQQANADEKGSPIHPVTGDDSKAAEEDPGMDHEPPLIDEKNNKNITKGDAVSRRDDEHSPGADPNLGPAPFATDTGDNDLLNNKRRDSDNTSNLDDGRRPPDETPPSQRFF